MVHSSSANNAKAVVQSGHELSGEDVLCFRCLCATTCASILTSSRQVQKKLLSDFSAQWQCPFMRENIVAAGSWRDRRSSRRLDFCVSLSKELVSSTTSRQCGTRQAWPASRTTLRFLSFFCFVWAHSLSADLEGSESRLTSLGWKTQHPGRATHLF